MNGKQTTQIKITRVAKLDSHVWAVFDLSNRTRALDQLGRYQAASRGPPGTTTTTH